jgi:hypothetical protein
MKALALLPVLLLSWPTFWLFKKGWRLFITLFFAALISGCVSTSNTSDRSPCACSFESLNTGNFRGGADA